MLKLSNDRVGDCRKQENSSARPPCKMPICGAFVSRPNWRGTLRLTGPSSHTARLHSPPWRRVLPENERRRFRLAATLHTDFRAETIHRTPRGPAARDPMLSAIAATGLNPE